MASAMTKLDCRLLVCLLDGDWPMAWTSEAKMKRRSHQFLRWLWRMKLRTQGLGIHSVQPRELRCWNDTGFTQEDCCVTSDGTSKVASRPPPKQGRRQRRILQIAANMQDARQEARGAGPASGKARHGAASQAGRGTPVQMCMQRRRHLYRNMSPRQARLVPNSDGFWRPKRRRMTRGFPAKVIWIKVHRADMW
jgi:hypothetical protein